MTLRECYDKLEGDFEGVISRLVSEDLVMRIVPTFLQDESFQALEKALEESNYEEAFRAAHTLKGVCENLSFTKLANAASEITEQLRGGVEPEDGHYFEDVKKAYEQTIEALKQL